VESLADIGSLEQENHLATFCARRQRRVLVIQARGELPNGGEIDCLIDAQSRRVGKKLNEQVVARWIYSGQLGPVAQLDSAGNITAS
jgi:hypothetical protein